MTATKTLSPAKTLDTLTWREVDARLAHHPDCRRIIQGERFALADAIRSGDGKRIADATAEAHRVAAMWSEAVGFDLLG